MKHILVELLSGLTLLTEEEKIDIEESFPIKTFKKGAYLIKEGQVAINAYHIVEGCVRAYKLMDGEEKTTAFYTENQAVIDFYSLSNQAPSKLNFMCNEDTTVAIINSDKEQGLYKKYPRFETFCRIGMEKMMGANQEQGTEYMVLKPEQRYRKLQKERPEVINRFPQYQIASYLGIKPETLSRIRQRMLK